MTTTHITAIEKIKSKTIKEQVQFVYNLVQSDSDILEIRELLIPNFTHILYAIKEANKPDFKKPLPKDPNTIDEIIIDQTIKILESKNNK
jgi:hypothetical protein